MLKRMAAILLMIFMLVPTLTACGGSGGVTESSNDVSTGLVETTTDDGFVDDRIPDDLKYGGEYVNILVDESDVVKFDVESAMGENVVDDAIYFRNREVESRLDVKLNFIPAETSGDVWGKRNSFIALVEQAANGNTGEYDLICGNSRHIAGTVLNGYGVDLLEFDVLDFDAPWWSDSLIETSAVNGRLYYGSGDICSSVIYYMYLTFFNTTMIADLGLESPYDLVQKNEWTIDKMYEMSEGLYTDLNASYTKDTSDTYGITLHRNTLDALYYGCGYMVIERSGDTLVLSDDFLGAGTRDYIVKMIEMFLETNDNYYLNDTKIRGVFGSNRALFLLDTPICVKNALDDYVDCIYGIVPVPKLDTTQSEYYSGMNFGYTTYMLFAGSPKLDMAATVLECMASEGYRKMTPAVFEVTMKYQYALDDVAARMFDIVKESIVFDFARDFSMDLPSTPNSMRWSAIASQNKDWIGLVSKSGRIMESGLTKILETFAKNYK